jgi:hypothetical protein
MKNNFALIVVTVTTFAYNVLRHFVDEKKLEKWKPIHLCWWFIRNDIPIPAYFIGKVSAPTVSTQAATSVSYTTATFNGTISSTGGANPTVRGFCYMVGTSGTPTTANSVVNQSGSFTTGTYSLPVTGLAAGTGYRVAAYATNSSGTAYGLVVQVTTLTNTPPTVSLNSPSNGSSTTNTTPTVNFTGTDSQSEAIEYNVQVDTTNTFNSVSGSPLISAFSATNAGFSSGHPFASGAAVNYAVQQGLATGTYYWRVAAIDPTGSNTYGAWSSTWSIIVTAPPFTIAGTSNQTSGTVSVAINSTLQGSTTTIASNGTWTISGVTQPTAGDAVTVFISSASSANVSTAVTTYGGSGGITGMVLNTHVLSLGSTQTQSLVLNDLGKYDYDQDSAHILHSANGSPATLLMDPGNVYSDESLVILSGNTLTVGATESLTTYDLVINGTVTSGGASAYIITHNWTNNGTFTAASSTVTLSGTTQQTLAGTLTSGSAFYNLTISNTSGTNPSDNERTGFVAGVIFSVAATITGAYTIGSGSARIQYLSGATYSVTNVNWVGTAGSLIYFRNSATTGTWLLEVTGVQLSVSYINVSRSDASVSGGTVIAAFNKTNVDATNNVNWLFTNTRIRQEINLIDGTSVSLSSSGQTIGLSSLKPNYGGTLTAQLEVVATNTDTVAQTIGVYNQSTSSLIVSVSIPSGTTQPTLFQSAAFTFPTSAITAYTTIPQTTSSSQVTLTSARIVILQDLGTGLLTSTETQVEIGNDEGGKRNTTSSPLTYPKYWHYTAANWDSSPTFSAEVTYIVSTSSTQANTTITLEQDNLGDLATWSTAATIVNADHSTAMTLSPRVSFTPIDGTNYRIASVIRNTSYSYDIYTAKIVINQSGTSVTKVEPQYLVANTSIGLGLQTDYIYWLPLQWHGASIQYYHEISADASSTDSAKLQYNPTTTPTDVTLSSATGSAYRSRGGLMTMPVASLMTVNTVSSPIYASRIIAVVNTALNTGMKVWTGTAWGYKPLKVWDGTAWVIKPLKVWDGTAWVVKG